ncbi:hypothetical protein BC828DRAFT_385658 [Blastocladiella britannica]|nr:hypothetical protein BC828DRAFT_385658 [Blastocladiella britannica]
MDEYILGILVEDLIPRDDKVEGIADYIAMTFDAADPDSVRVFIERALDTFSEFQAAADAELDDPSLNGSDNDDEDEDEGAAASSSSSARTGSKKLLTREAAQRRAAVLSKFAYELTPEAEAEAAAAAAAVAAAIEADPRLKYATKRSKKDTSYADVIGTPNENAKRIADAERAKRDIMKSQHDKKAAADKANLAKQKAQKEADKERRKTVKQERKR